MDFHIGLITSQEREASHLKCQDRCCMRSMCGGDAKALETIMIWITSK